MRRSILALAVSFFSLWSASAHSDPIVFSDDFSIDTTASYTWFEEGNGGDGDPLNNYTYDSANQWVNITTANNNNIYMGASLSTSLQSGYFEFSFMPYQTYPTDGLVRMRLYGVGDQSDMYMWHFARNSGYADAGYMQGYRAHLEKWVDGTPLTQEIFIPSPDHYDLGQWHTLAMSFSPTSMTGYLDGQMIMSVSDFSATTIDVGSLELVFQQQDQYVDNILISSDSPVIPPPSAVLLATLGLSLAGWKLRRREE